MDGFSIGSNKGRRRKASTKVRRQRPPTVVTAPIADARVERLRSRSATPPPLLEVDESPEDSHIESRPAVDSESLVTKLDANGSNRSQQQDAGLALLPTDAEGRVVGPRNIGHSLHNIVVAPEASQSDLVEQVTTESLRRRSARRRAAEELARSQAEGEAALARDRERMRVEGLLSVLGDAADPFGKLAPMVVGIVTPSLQRPQRRPDGGSPSPPQVEAEPDMGDRQLPQDMITIADEGDVRAGEVSGGGEAVKASSNGGGGSTKTRRARRAARRTVTADASRAKTPTSVPSSDAGDRAVAAANGDAAAVLAASRAALLSDATNSAMSDPSGSGVGADAGAILVATAQQAATLVDNNGFVDTKKRRQYGKRKRNQEFADLDGLPPEEKRAAKVGCLFVFVLLLFYCFLLLLLLCMF